MKRNKWVLPAVCTFAALLAGVFTGMSIFSLKHKKAAVILPEAAGETPGMTEEEIHDE